MENFKQIAEDCLAGKLSGTFVLRNGDTIPSKKLRRSNDDSISYPYIIYNYSYYTKEGNFFNSGETSEHDIINFIPDMIKEQITIDIPEGMEAVQYETPDGLKIKFIKKPLSYKDIEDKLPLHTKIQTQYFWDTNVNECYFSKKIEVIRKLINIRNHFGKPALHSEGWFIVSRWPEYNKFGAIPSIIMSKCPETVIFAKGEHAQAAIDMLGDELKYLFEPW